MIWKPVLYLLNRFVNKVIKREPDRRIFIKDKLYLERWFIIPRNTYFNIYIHVFHTSDGDRELHDHPWNNMSIIIENGYIEERFTPSGFLCMCYSTPGEVIFRKAEEAHRIAGILKIGEPGNSTVKTLFFTGRNRREWGFHCKEGWVPWHRFMEQKGRGS